MLKKNNLADLKLCEFFSKLFWDLKKGCEKNASSLKLNNPFEMLPVIHRP
jgi:hypothetical protein